MTHEERKINAENAFKEYLKSNVIDEYIGNIYPNDILIVFEDEGHLMYI